MNISNKHIQFVNIYLTNNFNGAKAYQEVYPTAKENTCIANANKVLMRPEVKEYIKQKQKELDNQCLITKVEMMRLLEEIAINGKRDSDKIAAISTMLKSRGLNEPDEIVTKNTTNIIWEENKTYLGDIKIDDDNLDG